MFLVFAKAIFMLPWNSDWDRISIPLFSNEKKKKINANEKCFSSWMNEKERNNWKLAGWLVGFDFELNWIQFYLLFVWRGSIRCNSLCFSFLLTKKKCINKYEKKFSVFSFPLWCASFVDFAANRVHRLVYNFYFYFVFIFCI